MKEEWKIYKESKNSRWGHRVYEVSNLGRVRLNGEIVEPYIVHGYPAYGKFFIHRAVAELFIPNPENKPHIDHINTIRTDNRAENLRWVTAKENCNNPLTKIKMIKSQRKRDPETYSHKPLTEEQKLKISAAHKGKTISEEHKRKIIAANTGRIKTEEELRKISIGNKGKIPWNKGLKLGKRKKRGN